MAGFVDPCFFGRGRPSQASESTIQYRFDEEGL
jgi:hypothetical protein